MATSNIKAEIQPNGLNFQTNTSRRVVVAEQTKTKDVVKENQQIIIYMYIISTNQCFAKPQESNVVHKNNFVIIIKLNQPHFLDSDEQSSN